MGHVSRHRRATKSAGKVVELIVRREMAEQSIAAMLVFGCDCGTADKPDEADPAPWLIVHSKHGPNPELGAN